MATDTRESADPAVELAEMDEPTKDWYDRSSLRGDFMVMIDDQTEEEYFRRCPEGQFCEFIDGIVYMPSPVSLQHQFDAQFLMFLLAGFNAKRKLGHVLTGPAAVRLREGCNVEPDIFVVPFDPRRTFDGYICDPPILLVVEVLSKSDRSYDLKMKAAHYQEAGVEEIWFVDRRGQALIVHRRSGDGYETLKVEAGPFFSQSLPGFWFDVDWLWAKPEPDVLECLTAILAGPPA